MPAVGHVHVACVGLALGQAPGADVAGAAGAFQRGAELEVHEGLGSARADVVQKLAQLPDAGVHAALLFVHVEEESELPLHLSLWGVRWGGVGCAGTCVFHNVCVLHLRGQPGLHQAKTALAEGVGRDGGGHLGVRESRLALGRELFTVQLGLGLV